jgi:hypothetical protein
LSRDAVALPSASTIAIRGIRGRAGPLQSAENWLNRNPVQHPTRKMPAAATTKRSVRFRAPNDWSVIGASCDSFTDRGPRRLPGRVKNPTETRLIAGPGNGIFAPPRPHCFDLPHAPRPLTRNMTACAARCNGKSTAPGPQHASVTRGWHKADNDAGSVAHRNCVRLSNCSTGCIRFLSVRCDSWPNSPCGRGWINGKPRRASLARHSRSAPLGEPARGVPPASGTSTRERCSCLLSLRGFASLQPRPHALN